MGDITDADFAQAKRDNKDFEIKHLREYHICMLKAIHYC